MARALTVFSILASAASIIGVLIQLLRPADQWPASILYPTCILAGLLCAYVLLVPGSWLESNVEKKFSSKRYFDTSGPADPNVLIQRGTIRFWGFQKRTVEFFEPFLDAPKFELVDTFNQLTRDGGMPEVILVTAHAAIVERQGGPLFTAPKCNWIARGRPLKGAQ